MDWLLENVAWVEFALLVVAGALITYWRGEDARKAALARLEAALAEALAELVAVVAGLAREALEDVTIEEVEAVAAVFYDKLPEWVKERVSLPVFQQAAWEAWERFLKVWHTEGTKAMRAFAK